MIKIVDNFLDEQSFSNIHRSICYTDNFPWYLSTGVSVALEGDKSSPDGNYFYHLLYYHYRPNSEYFNMLGPIIEKINPFAINRIKANFYPSTNEVVKHGWHSDYLFPHKGCIYYLNTNNGKTIFESGEEINSIQNRMVFFDPSKKHRSTTSSDTPVGRYNINFNFY
jgi:hypothetical protein